jgi:cysteine synthase B
VFEVLQTHLQHTSKMHKSIGNLIGNTPIVKITRLIPPVNLPNHLQHLKPQIFAKLEGNNPAGSVKDRAAFQMIVAAEEQGAIQPGDSLVEATSGNTGIALAMVAATKGYKLTLIMPENMSEERRAAMAAYGAHFVNVPPGAMEVARDLAQAMAKQGKGFVLDQFSNLANPLAHYLTTGPEIWRDTKGLVTHFVSSMGTTGTVVGTSKFLKEKNPNVQIIGLQPGEGSTIPGIRRWSPEYIPKIFDKSRVDQVLNISQREAEETMRAMARTEGIFAGTSSGGSLSAALRVAHQLTLDLLAPNAKIPEKPAVIVCIICDRGDRYLSTGMFDATARLHDPKPCTMEEWPSAAACLISFPGPRYVFFESEEIPLVREAIVAKGGTCQVVKLSNDVAFLRSLNLQPGKNTIVRWRSHIDGQVDSGDRAEISSIDQLNAFLEQSWGRNKPNWS